MFPSAMLLTSGSRRWEVLGIRFVEWDSMSGFSGSNSLSAGSSSLSFGSAAEGQASNHSKDYVGSCYLGVCSLRSVISCIIFIKEAIDMEWGDYAFTLGNESSADHVSYH